MAEQGRTTDSWPSNTALGAYWDAVKSEMRAIQHEETFLDIEMILYFESIRNEAIERLYVQGVYV